MKVSTLIVIVSILFTCSCSPKKGNFSVKAPDSWIRVDTVSKNGEKEVRMHPAVIATIPRFIENISISIVHSRNLDRYISSLMANVKETMDFYEEKGRGVLETK